MESMQSTLNSSPFWAVLILGGITWYNRNRWSQLTSRWRESARDVSRRALALMDPVCKCLRVLDSSLRSEHVSGGETSFAPETN